jgi:hypothetical protein
MRAFQQYQEQAPNFQKKLFKILLNLFDKNFQYSITLAE